MTTDASTARTYLPSLFTSPPTTPNEALIMTAVGLREENRWTKNILWDPLNQNDPEYRDDPFCDGWSACALGMLWMVSTGVVWNGTENRWIQARTTENPTGHRIYREAASVLITELDPSYRETHELTDVARFNDAFERTLPEVLALIDRAVLATAPAQAEAAEAAEETDTE